MWPIEWHRCQCPWMTLNVTFAVWNLSNSDTSWNIARIYYHSASRGPSVLAELFVCSAVCYETGLCYSIDMVLAACEGQIWGQVPKKSTNVLLLSRLDKLTEMRSHFTSNLVAAVLWRSLFRGHFFSFIFLLKAMLCFWGHIQWLRRHELWSRLSSVSLYRT